MAAERGVQWQRSGGRNGSCAGGAMAAVRPSSQRAGSEAKMGCGPGKSRPAARARALKGEPGG